MYASLSDADASATLRGAKRNDVPGSAFEAPPASVPTAWAALGRARKSSGLNVTEESFPGPSGVSWPCIRVAVRSSPSGSQAMEDARTDGAVLDENWVSDVKITIKQAVCVDTISISTHRPLEGRTDA